MASASRMESSSSSSSSSMTVPPTGAVAMAATENKAEGSRPGPRDGLNKELEDTVRETERGDRPPRSEWREDDTTEDREADDATVIDDVSVSHFLTADVGWNLSPTSDRGVAPFFLLFIGSGCWFSLRYHVDDVVGTPKAAAAATAVVAVSLCVDIVQGCSGLQGYENGYSLLFIVSLLSSRSQTKTLSVTDPLSWHDFYTPPSSIEKKAVARPLLQSTSINNSDVVRPPLRNLRFVLFVEVVLLVGHHKWLGNSNTMTTTDLEVDHSAYLHLHD